MSPTLRSPRFLLSIAKADQVPVFETPQVVVIGRSNVGKSTFINAIAGTRIARTSSTPGRTRLLNLFDFGQFVLVDTPGIGYASVSKEQSREFSLLLEGYLALGTMSLVILLIDSRHPMSAAEVAIADRFASRLLVVATKGDKLNQSARALHRNDIKGRDFYPDRYHLVAPNRPDSYRQVLEKIIAIVA